MKAACESDQATVISLVNAGYKDLDERGEWGGTAIFAWWGLEGAVKALLAAGANKDAKTDVLRCTGDDPPDDG